MFTDDIWDNRLYGWWMYDCLNDTWFFLDAITGWWYSEWEFSPLDLPWFVSGG